MNIGNYADGVRVASFGKVEKSAADQVADVAGVVFESKALRLAYNDIEAGEGLSGADGVDSTQMKDDAALTAAYRQPECDNLSGAGLTGTSGEVFRGKEDLRVCVKTLGKVGEELCENLALATLRTQDVGEQDPPRFIGLRQAAALTGLFRNEGGWSDLLSRGLSHFQNIKRETMLQLHAGSREDGPDGACRAALFPDDLSNVFGGDTKAKDR